MSLGGKQWIWPNHDQNLITDLTRDLDLTPALARLLISRGITSSEQARAFLQPLPEQLHSPWLMLGMEQAVDRLFAAFNKGEKTIIYGDYDADGISATVIMVETLRRLGAEVDYYLPSRDKEGYGLHVESLQQIIEAEASLVVTVDCGINAAEEVAYAAANGLDIIITDHHQPLTTFSGAVSIINPRQKKCSYPYKELSGAGIAFKFASAIMEKAKKPFPEHLLDLAALGTTADVVPLLGENRIIVSAGLEILRRKQRIGFKALIDQVSLKEEHITSNALSFVIAPAINAAGRMGEALPAAELLLEDNLQKAEALAWQLQQANQLRRSTEQRILLEAEEAALDLLGKEDYKVITLAKESWHHGVIGIVASRLVEKFNRPFCLVALDGDQGQGSARSIPGFDITAALSDCSAVLERFGGHEQAAGFTVQTSKIGVLRECLKRYARQNMDDSYLTPHLYIDAEIDQSEIQFNLTTQLEKMQPFGTANPVPLFGSHDWVVRSWRLVGGDQKHLKLNLNKNGRSLDPIYFSGAFLDPLLEKGRRVNIAFKLKNGFYRNQKTLEAEIKDLTYSDTFRSGKLEIIDRRNCAERMAGLNHLLNRADNKAVVFTATRSRSEKIQEGISLKGSPVIITSGSMNEDIKIPETHELLILYDLPLHQDILKYIFEKGLIKESTAVHLFYNPDDLKLNRQLMDMSLPSGTLLEKIIKALPGSEAKSSTFCFQELALDSIDFKPAPSFWERSEAIFTEIGLLENGCLAPQWMEIENNWPDCLDSSPTYRFTIELRRQCEQFQKLFQEAPLEKIASYLHKLAGD